MTELVIRKAYEIYSMNGPRWADRSVHRRTFSKSLAETKLAETRLNNQRAKLATIDVVKMNGKWRILLKSLVKIQDESEELMPS